MATTTNFGWETPDDTDLVKDGALAIRTLGSAIDTSLVDLKGGTTGQVLSKTSNTDMDFTWVTSDDANAIQNAIVDAKGDLIAASAADTPARLAVGTDGQVLTADSTTATGLKWATSAASPVKAWVEFDGTGTVTILASNNVSSISDNGVGVYKVNYTTAIGSDNYCFLLSVAKVGGIISSSTARHIYAQEDEIKSAGLQVNVTNGSYSLADSDFVSVAVLA